MDWDELLSLMTLGAVFPYLTAAAANWIGKPSSNQHGANAPT